MAKRRISESDGIAAVRAVVAAQAAGWSVGGGEDAAAPVVGPAAVPAPVAAALPVPAPDRQTLATAVRFLLEELAALAPGNSVEVRVPPFGATQCVAGPRHTRGTPANVIETDPGTWVALATGTLAWGDVVSEAMVVASGTRANLEGLLPLVRVAPAAGGAAADLAAGSGLDPAAHSEA